MNEFLPLPLLLRVMQPLQRWPAYASQRMPSTALTQKRLRVRELVLVLVLQPAARLVQAQAAEWY